MAQGSQPAAQTPAQPSAPEQPQAVCPACKAPVTPDNKFCPACGASLAAPVQAPPKPPSIDIRERVDQDRGALKRLQLLIPGYRTYRLGEDIRAADSMLRLQVADRMVRAMQLVDTMRSDMARNGMAMSMTDIGSLRSKLQRIEGQIRHAEGGYTGISPQVRITPEKLDRLYERDWSFISASENVVASIQPVQDAVNAKDQAKVGQLIGNLRTALTDLENNFATRLADVEKILQ